MYKNAYNEEIVREIDVINQRYVLFQQEQSNLQPTVFGGSAYDTFRDSGFGQNFEKPDAMIENKYMMPEPPLLSSGPIIRGSTLRPKEYTGLRNDFAGLGGALGSGGYVNQAKDIKQPAGTRKIGGQVKGVEVGARAVGGKKKKGGSYLTDYVDKKGKTLKKALQIAKAVAPLVPLLTGSGPEQKVSDVHIAKEPEATGGKKKKASSYIDFVKSIAKKEKIPYGQAISFVSKNKLWKK